MNVTLCLLYIIKIGLKSEVLLYHQGWCLLEQASGNHASFLYLLVNAPVMLSL